MVERWNVRIESTSATPEYQVCAEPDGTDRDRGINLFTLRTVYVVPVVYTFLENSERRQAYGSPDGNAVRGVCLTYSARGLTRVNVSTWLCVSRSAWCAACHDIEFNAG